MRIANQDRNATFGELFIHAHPLVRRGEGGCRRKGKCAILKSSTTVFANTVPLFEPIAQFANRNIPTTYIAFTPNLHLSSPPVLPFSKRYYGIGLCLAFPFCTPPNNNSNIASVAVLPQTGLRPQFYPSFSASFSAGTLGKSSLVSRPSTRLLAPALCKYSKTQSGCTRPYPHYRICHKRNRHYRPSSSASNRSITMSTASSVMAA